MVPVAGKERLVSFWAICLVSMVVFSVLGYSTAFGRNLSDEADFDFIKGEREQLEDVVAPWFGTLFWIYTAIVWTMVLVGRAVLRGAALRLLRGVVRDHALDEPF